MPFRIIESNIEDINVDAIAYVINDDNIDKEEPLIVDTKLTYDLHSIFVIHVSCPAWQDDENDESEILKNHFTMALELAYQKGCKSIAFPLSSICDIGFPKELSLDVAISAFTSFLENYEIEIILAIFDFDDSILSDNLLFDDVDEFLYENCAYCSSCFDGLLNNKIQIIEEERPCELPCDECVLIDEESLDDALKNIYKESFGKYLQQLINKKGFKNSSVYARANISKQYFSKLLNNQIKPSKEKMLALAIGLKLNIDETIDFLKFAGYALSPISQTDKIVEFFIEREEYNVIKIDIALFDYGLEPLSK